MKILFGILHLLNNIACILTLTAFIFWYRRPDKKNDSESNSKAKNEFSQHWHLMIWWVLGTLLVGAFEANILWILAWMIVGAYILTFFNRENAVEGKSPEERSAKQPTLLPDFGKHLAATGTPQRTLLIYTSWDIDTLQVIDADRYCTTRIQSSEGHLYCATFEFDNGILTDLMKAATERTQDFIAEKLIDDPFSVRSMILPDPISVGIAAVLGNLQQGLYDFLIPLVIKEVIGVTADEETAAL
jgi:uncharacterized membrane protein